MQIKIKGDYIKLDQVVKLSGVVESGAMAKVIIQDNLVLVNNEVETRRGRKLYEGDVVLINVEEIVKIELL